MGAILQVLVDFHRPTGWQLQRRIDFNRPVYAKRDAKRASFVRRSIHGRIELAEPSALDRARALAFLLDYANRVMEPVDREAAITLRRLLVSL